MSVYRPLGVPYVVTQRGADLGEVRDRLHGKVSVLLGHSGVGKSTLVNALVPGSDRQVGQVNAVTGRGRQTSTSAIMLALPDPLRRLDRGHARASAPSGSRTCEPARLIDAFPDLAALTDACPRGCTHGESEPECGLDEAVAEGRTDAARVDSFRRLLASREAAVD